MPKGGRAYILVNGDPLVRIGGNQDGASVGVDNLLLVPGLEVLQDGVLGQLREPGHVIHVTVGCQNKGSQP